jgi:CheY-like chemotaxis protein
VRAAVESVRPSAQAKGVGLELHLPQAPLLSLGDASRLQQCFWNLLSNAIKFTPRGGHVRVHVERVDSRHRVRVDDDGEGIGPEFLPHLFERFRQADASSTRRHGGLGLGLSIVKSLVDLHGGAVGASSAGHGRGASFHVDLPVLAVDPHGLDALRASGAEPGAPASFDHPSLSGLRVLCVDDDPDALRLVQRLLEGCGAEVLLAGGADDALALVRRRRPDLVLSDLGMPGTDGYELMRRVRRLPREEGGLTPAVALSAFARAEDRTRALREGYQAHVAKPVEPTELTAIVASMALRR